MSTDIVIKTIGLKEVEDFFEGEVVNEPNYLFPTHHVSIIRYSYEVGQRILYGAYIGQELVGYCLTDTPTNNLDLIYVSNKHRGKGVGTALVLSCGAKAVTVDEKNTRAIRIYVKAGLVVHLIKPLQS